MRRRCIIAPAARIAIVIDRIPMSGRHGAPVTAIGMADIPDIDRLRAHRVIAMVIACSTRADAVVHILLVTHRIESDAWLPTMQGSM